MACRVGDKTRIVNNAYFCQGCVHECSKLYDYHIYTKLIIDALIHILAQIVLLSVHQSPRQQNSKPTLLEKKNALSICIQV